MRNVSKVRIYPTQEQEAILAKAFGSVRWLWNYALALNNQTYLETGKGISGMDLKKKIPLLKKEYPWLAETYSQCLQQSILNLSQTFVNFFEKKAGYPRFKSKHGKQSLQYPQNIKVLDKALSIPKIGVVKADLHRLFSGDLKTVTISKTKTGKYYASLLFENDLLESEISSKGKAIGIDLGLTHFCITSEGSKFNNPRHFKKHERNLKRKQQKLSRKPSGSKSREKARKLVARAYEKISNARQDFLHKLSRKLVNENQVIITENLNVKGMVRNHKLALAISDVSWGMFCNFLDYKAKRDGKVYLEVDRFFPSSKTCNVCLNVIGSLPLSVRSWECPNCQTKHDRDITAAINIRDEGLRLLSCGARETAGVTQRKSRAGRKSSVVAGADDPRSQHHITQ